MEDQHMSFHLPSGIALLALCLGLSGCEREVSFANDVQPIFRDHCVECHSQIGEGVAASGFSVNDYDSIMGGTKFGPVVVPGNSNSSALYMVVAGKTAPEIQMPPHHQQSLSAERGDALSEENIEVIQLWIDQGALNN
jgi:hypothetical protein